MTTKYSKMISFSLRKAVLLPLFVGLFHTLHAQINIEKPNIAASTYLGGNYAEYPIAVQVIGNEVHIIGHGESTNYPVTNGSKYGGGGRDLVYTKLNASTGAIITSTYLGGSGYDQALAMQVIGGEVHILGSTSSGNYPVTNGSTYGGGVQDLVYSKLNASTGAIITSTYLGGSGGDFAVITYATPMLVMAGEVHIAGYSTSSDYPVTNSSTYGGGGGDIVYTKLNASTGDILTSTYLGGSESDETPILQVAGSDVHILGTSASSNYPVTNSSTYVGGGGDIVYTRLNASTGAIITSAYLGGGNYEYAKYLQIVGGELIFVGITYSFDYPVTNGSANSGGQEMVYTKVNTSTGAIITSTYLGGNNSEQLYDMQVLGGELHILGHTNSNDYPVTNGSLLGGQDDIFYTKLNASTGAIMTSTYLGEYDIEYAAALQVVGGEVHIAGRSSSGNYPVTNGSTFGGGYDIIYTKLNTGTGAIISSTYLGGDYSDEALAIKVIGNEAYIVGQASSRSYPVTNTTTSDGGYGDMGYTKLNLCPVGYAGMPTVTPSVQNVCINGLFSPIKMDNDSIPGASQPTIYRDGVSGQQIALTALYQWQESNSFSGPFTDIPGAIEKNYTPASAGATKYYRRISYSMCNGVKTIQQTGDVASLIVGPNTAPTVNAGGLFNTCPGTAVTIGGAPTATAAAGASITSYEWTPSTGLSSTTIANPVASPASSTIYTVLVTDNNGCQQLGQASTTVYQANAGPDVSSCAGNTVRIGAQQIPVAGATYSWTSSPAGFTSTSAQPLVNPLVTTTYTLTLTLPITGGGTCNTTDDVEVTPVSAPTNNSGLFAGDDVTICNGSTALLGASGADVGYTYTWAPGNYLPQNNLQQPTFTPGGINLPDPNPFTYYLTALKDGCIFVDSVKAYVIQANAGTDGCGPRYIGADDATPNIAETYSWSVVSGTAHFLGATNLPKIPVGGSTGTPTVYRLTTIYNGVTCTDDVTVPVCGCPTPSITVTAPYGCPDYSLNGGNVLLTASNGYSDYTFTWTTTGGVTLSAYSGTTVSLTNDSNGTVTVTGTSTLDPSVFCSYTISVSNPAWSLPVFTAKDTTICPGVSVAIGAASVSGYSYLWDAIPTLSAYNVSNPNATVNATTDFKVLVTDVGSGCTTRDTATITIAGLPNNAAGNDFTICGSVAGVTLGSTPVSGVSYAWTSSPAGAVFSPDSTVANPMVNIAITTTFTVTATNASTGCSLTDDVTATVVSSVTPFTFTDSTYCPSDFGGIPLPPGPAGMTSYSWSPAPRVINPSSNGPAATTLDPRPQVATTYTLTVTNSGGCTEKASITLTPTVSLPNAGNDRSICLNSGAVSIGSAGNPMGAGISYSWSPGTNLSSSTDPNPIFTPPGTGSFKYTLTKTEAGCSTTDQVTITVNDFNLPALTSPTICSGSSVQIGTTPVFGTSYSWSPSAGLSATNISNPLATPSATTTYTLTGMGINGCVDRKSAIVTVLSASAPAITLNNSSVCLGSTLTFNPVINPSGVYTYTWSPNDGSLSNIYIYNPQVVFFSLGTKTYNLFITDTATGCFNSKNVSVQVNYCPLPVELLSFKAQCHDGYVILRWQTAQEENSSYFGVERSADGRSWETLDKAPAAGSNYNLLNYQYTDKTNPEKSGYTFYRLKLVDMNGSYEYSRVVYADCNAQAANEINVYPNPVENELQVVSTDAIGKISLHSMQGKLIFTMHVTSNKTIISTTGLAQGGYILNIAGKSFKIIKQ